MSILCARRGAAADVKSEGPRTGKADEALRVWILRGRASEVCVFECMEVWEIGMGRGGKGHVF